jgi:tryptophan-rich sensory protein
MFAYNEGEVICMNAVIKLPPLLFHIALPVAAGIVSSFLAGDRAAAYASLRLPGYALPLAAFDALSALAYGCMGVASYLIFTSRRLRRGERGGCMGLYALLLVAGALWSLLFFRFRFCTFAAWWSVLLLAVTVLAAALFFRIRKHAGLFLIPCGVWAGYLVAVGFGAARLN